MKIKGKFAPLTDELGYDPRFKELNDLEKLMYVLIIHTCHMTRHQAPTDPNYYRMQYGIRHRLAEVKQAISKCQATYKQLRCNSGKLSLINSATYESQICLEEETEEEVDIETNKQKPIKETRTYTPRASFIAPSLADVEAHFVSLSAPADDAKDFFFHYEKVNWIPKGYKTQMSSWKAAASQWIGRNKKWNKGGMNGLDNNQKERQRPVITTADIEADRSRGSEGTGEIRFKTRQPETQTS
jgi:hypothetical protein